MWNVEPVLLCDKHLLGEHVEMHMFMGTLTKGVSVNGYILGGLVEVHNIIRRHDALAEEMTARGMKHASPAVNMELPTAGSVDVGANLIELSRRCGECKRRIENDHDS